MDNKLEEGNTNVLKQTVSIAYGGAQKTKFFTQAQFYSKTNVPVLLALHPGEKILCKNGVLKFPQFIIYTVTLTPVHLDNHFGIKYFPKSLYCSSALTCGNSSKKNTHLFATFTALQWRFKSNRIIEIN